MQEQMDICAYRGQWLSEKRTRPRLLIYREEKNNRALKEREKECETAPGAIGVSGRS